MTNIPDGVESFDFALYTQHDANGRPTVRYTPFTDGHAVGFCVEEIDATGEANGRRKFIYLNPSDNRAGEDVANVFLYQGPHGRPDCDGAEVHFLVLESEDRDCDEACANHTPECDGFCDHLPGHVNACMKYAANR